ncbi:MAG: DmsE family decaheme c-type cytochrome [Rhodocyclaceae bacterium]|nr:DmsE family decaheme c-type cytochrome [Rhodocyclaceae bacterium]
MKMFRQLLLACAAMAGISLSSGSLAAGGGIPETNLGGGSKAAQTQAALAKDKLCTRCHDQNEMNPVLSIYQTRHGVKADARTPSCQSCHGESEKHLKGDPNAKDAQPRIAPDVVFRKNIYQLSDAKLRAAPCLTCHKGSARSRWDGSQHQNSNLACNDCHKVHQPADAVLSKKTQTEVCFTCHKDQRAQTHRISTHPLDAGKMGCSDCHNPHGSVGPKLLVKKTVNETCFTCHPDRRGPFLWEHQPVADDCTTCHTPHGSTNAPLLKARLPQLCQECHTGDHARNAYSGATLPGGANNVIKPLQGQSGANQIYSRDCLNCHSNIHGSNSPAGAKFQR